MVKNVWFQEPFLLIETALVPTVMNSSLTTATGLITIRIVKNSILVKARMQPGLMEGLQLFLSLPLPYSFCLYRILLLCSTHPVECNCSRPPKFTCYKCWPCSKTDYQFLSPLPILGRDFLTAHLARVHHCPIR